MISKEFFEDIMFNKINISFIGASICAAYGIYYALYVVHVSISLCHAPGD